MTVVLRDVLAALETLYPPSTALSWDRVGLVTGDPDQPVRRIHFALDPTLAVIEEAVASGADLLVTHHPLLLRGIHSVATTHAKGAAVTSAVVADLAIYCAHTSADVAEPGVSHALAAACGLETTTPLDHDEGRPLGAVGELAEPMSLRDFAIRLAAALPRAAGGIRVAGDPDASVGRVAVMGGSGDDRFEAVRRAGADVYVTADLRHHPALEAREESRVRGRGRPFLVDAGHWASESLWLAHARERLLAALGDAGTTVESWVSTLRTDPWDFTVGAEDGSDPAPDSGGAR